MPFRTHVEIEEHEKGKAEGKAEGESIGLVRAKRDDVIHILLARFGAVPEALVSRVGSIDDLTALDRLVERAALARDLADFRSET